MEIKIRVLVLCGAKITTALAIEANSASNMVKVLIMVIIQKFQSVFYSRVSAFSQ